MTVTLCSQIDISGNLKVVVVHVPYRLRKGYRKIYVRLVRELEKKFSGKDVILIATRRILRPPKKGSAAVRPRSRTLTALHDATLEDVVYPAEIVGKRVRYRLDGSKRCFRRHLLIFQITLGSYLSIIRIDSVGHLEF
ncbi:small ribosomal subunit protein eS7-like [Aristolochia californica]|uniref:small ribosomal subunit protein eS7-like n=1 Tax=Aristolochia californica TaxID=171875 RepID=UPI0035DBD554